MLCLQPPRPHSPMSFPGTPSRPRRRRRLSGAGTAELPEAPGQKPQVSSLLPTPSCRLVFGGVWGGFFSQYTGLGVGFFFSMNGPKNQDGTNISELVEFNQPLTLVLIKAEIRTAGTVTPRVTITAP